MRFLISGIGELVLQELGQAIEARLAVAFFSPTDPILAALGAIHDVTGREWLLGRCRSELTVEQGREAVLALLRREEPAAQKTRRYGVSEQTLYRWRDEFPAAGAAALATGKNGSDTPRP